MTKAGKKRCQFRSAPFACRMRETVKVDAFLGLPQPQLGGADLPRCLSEKPISAQTICERPQLVSAFMATSAAASARLDQIAGAFENRGGDRNSKLSMSWPQLPSRAAYLVLNNARRRNALSLNILRDLKQQLTAFNTSPVDGQLRMLPPFRPEVLRDLESTLTNGSAETNPYDWLVNGQKWEQHRGGLPKVLVLRSEGPVFCSGHDLGELKSLPYEEVKETFALCAEVMSLIRRSPAPVVGMVQGLATAAGMQLALTTDLPITCQSTQFRLPGASMGLPCTSPSTAVSRRLGNAFTYRMLALAEPMKAEELPGGAVEVVADQATLEQRVAEIAHQLAEKTAGQPQALGKWAFWTQAGLNGGATGGDGYEAAVDFAGKVMALHAKAADAKEGMESFFEKRPPSWST